MIRALVCGLHPSSKRFLAGALLFALMGCMSGMGVAWGQKPPAAPFKILLVKSPAGSTEAVATLRGDGLENIDAVQFLAQKPGSTPLPLKVVKVEKNAPPMARPAVRGGAGWLQLQVKSIPAGEIGKMQFLEKEKKLLGELPWPLWEAAALSEKEPNNGFLDANPLIDGRWIHGKIAPAKDVDVFVWELPKGRNGVEIRLGASQKYSLLDPFLMIHNERGDLIKEMALTTGENPTVPLGAAGKYYFSFLDINDTESEFHHYQFQLLSKQ